MYNYVYNCNNIIHRNGLKTGLHEIVRLTPAPPFEMFNALI